MEIRYTSGGWSLWTALLFLFFLPFLVPLSAAEKYPDWFLYQDRYPGIVVGYGVKGADAVQDAEQRYVTFRRCIMTGALYRYRDWDEKHSDYFYEYHPDSLRKVLGNFRTLGRFTTSMLTRDIIGAFSMQVNASVDRNYSHIQEIPEPEWLGKAPVYTDSDYFYGVGSYSFRGNEADAWRTAEEKAILNVVIYRRVKVYNSISSERSTGENDSLEELNALIFDYDIRDIEVLRRWRDADNKQVHILVRIPLNGISDRE